MSADPASSGSILLAWAVPVDLAWLGARLFAYVRTKATITTLRLVSKNSPLTACRSLPEEIISLIAIEVREMVFQLKIDDWVKFTTYLSSWRLTQVRLFDTDLKNLCSMAQVDWCDEGYEELSAVDSLVNAESHPENLELMCKFLTDTEGTTLAKCSQIFAQDFAIRPYLKFRKFYDSEENRLNHVEVKAYLTLPLLSTRVFSNQGPGMALFEVEDVLNPTTLIGPIKHQLQQFTIASNILGPRIFDPDEHTPVFEDKLSVSKVPSSDKNPQLGKSNEGNGAESNEAERNEGTRPQLMILGYGELEAGPSEDY